MYNRKIIKQVWEKAIPQLNCNSCQVRKDTCGAWIVSGDYGNRDSEYGWEIDHIIICYLIRCLILNISSKFQL